MQDNALSGALPDELADLTNLEELLLNESRALTGPLPDGLRELSDLETVQIQDTELCAPDDDTFQTWLATITFSGLICPPDEQSVIDVAVFYTPAARAAQGGTTEIEMSVDLMVAQTNAAYQASGVHQRIKLVAVEEVVGYTELIESSTDLNRLRLPSDGYMDEVHDVRGMVAADIVLLVRAGRGSQAYQMGTPSQDFASQAFGVARSGNAGAFAHELGHLMGLRHDRYVSCGGRCNNAPHFPYAFGYVNQRAFDPNDPESPNPDPTVPTTARWRTIMSYNNQCAAADFGCQWLFRFSNPDQLHPDPGGDPLGKAGLELAPGADGPSDAVRMLNRTRGYVANFRTVSGTIIPPHPPPPPPPPPNGGGDGGPQETVPSAPRNLLAEGGDGQVTLTWDAPEDDGGSEITDYQYRINGRNPWTAIGSTDTTHTVTGLVNGTAYVFEVRAVNRIGRGRASNRAEATPEAPEVFTLDFAHFANGTSITSDLVLVNVAPQPVRPAIYFYDTEGAPIAAESVLEVTADLEIQEDGGLTVQTEMDPLGVLTISTHGRGELVSGSVKVLSDGPIGGGVRYGVPEIGVAGVGASPPVRDVLFPARRQEGGIRTATALHNLGEEAVGVRCRLMSGGVSLEEVEIPLEANGQASWFIEEAFPTTDTSDFLGSVRCTVLGSRRFTAIAVEMDAAQRIFNTLSVVPVDRTGGGNKQTTLDFAHFVNGTWITDLVFVNLSTEASRPAPTPFHTDILPSRPAIYFYDTEGALVAPESVVDITGDLEITEDGALTVRTEMEPLGVLTISTHGRGELVSGSARVVSDGPIGGMLRFEHPDFGVAGVGASPPLSDALFPVRRQEGGINDRSRPPQPGIESGAGALRLDAGGRAARRREHPSGGQWADVLAHRPGGPCRRYVRLRGVGALRCGGGGAVQRRGPGNGPHHRRKGLSPASIR